jgi:hypothetical protein
MSAKSTPIVFPLIPKVVAPSNPSDPSLAPFPHEISVKTKKIKRMFFMLSAL